MTGVDALVEVAPTIPRPLHGGFGDGALHIIPGTPLGQKNEDVPALVRQDALDISKGSTRYNFASQVEYFNPATGNREIRPGFETITYVGERGVLVLNPTTGKASDIMTPNAFARETEKTGGLLPLDMITARHSLSDGNPLITAMAKDALRATITMLGAATPAPGAQADMSVLANRRHALEERLNAMQ